MAELDFSHAPSSSRFWADEKNAARAESRVGTSAHSGASVGVEGLSREFSTADGVVPAICDIHLTIEGGEFSVIVGPSGCGKTTLLRIIAGLDRPTSGSVTTTGAAGRAPRNAMVFQGRSVFPWLTVAQNVAYGLKLRGVSRRARSARIGDLLRIVGLADTAHAYPHQLSEGMRQRVAIARALAVDPDILLMDEPFGSLDEQTRLLLQEELLRIWEHSGKTVIFVTHSIDEAILLGDRVIVMSSRPGTIKAALPIPFPRPRALSDIRSSPDFSPLFSEIWGLLRDEVLSARELSSPGITKK